jgi:hypothetical protein
VSQKAFVNLILIAICQAHKTDYFVSRFDGVRANKEYPGWVGAVFTLFYFPGGIFIFSPAKFIQGVSHLVGIRSRPIQIPRTVWGAGWSSTDWLPWVQRDIPPQSWVRISKCGLPYSGDLAYVVGCARSSDTMLIAVVPRIHDDVVEYEEGKQKWGKRPKPTGRRKMKPPSALFDFDAMITRHGQSAVHPQPFRGMQGFVTIFADKFANQVVTRDPDSNEKVVSRVPLDLADFDWVNIPTSEQIAYQFEGHLFYHGLLILPIYSYGGVQEIKIPPVYELIPFAESCIDPVHIDPLLSQLHWQTGDRVSYFDIPYKLQDIQIDRGSASVAYLPTGETTRPSPLIELPLKDLRRIFLSGDVVAVVAGLHKGLTGSVLRNEDGVLHILTDNDGHYVSIVY